MNFYMTFENNTSSCLRTTLMNFFDPLQMLTIYLCHMDSILIHFSMKHWLHPNSVEACGLYSSMRGSITLKWDKKKTKKNIWIAYFQLGIVIFCICLLRFINNIFHSSLNEMITYITDHTSFLVLVFLVF